MARSSLYNAQYRLVNHPPEPLWLGEPMLLTIEVTNPGPLPWLTSGPHPVRLSYRWQTPQGEAVVPEGPRTPLPSPVPPGERVTVEVRVESPPQPGRYDLVVDLVEEGMVWFAQQGVPPLVLAQTYLPDTAPRATIVVAICLVRDAVGNHVAAMLHSLRAAGYQTLLMVEHSDPRQTEEVRRLTAVVRLTDITHPTPQSQGAADHFFSSDVVIVVYPLYYELADLIKLACHSAVVFDYHSVTPPELWGPEQPGYTNLIIGQQRVDLVQYADYAIARSSFTGEELVRTGLIPSDRVVVTPLGSITPSDPSPGAPDPALVARYKPHGERVLLYVGRMARNKRLIDLVEALALVRQQVPNTVLLLVGDNTFPLYRAYADEILERASELGCRDQILFTGQVPDLDPYYRLCDMLVTASVHEGLGMPVIEAMRHGKPVVAAASAALPETVDGGGLLCEPLNPRDMAGKVVHLLRGLSSPPDAPPRDETGADVSWLRQKIIAFVVPRYGPGITGGAERGIRGWAEHLARCGYRVEVLTTDLTSLVDFSRTHAPGVEEVQGVTVRRFAANPVDIRILHTVQRKALDGEPIRYDEQQAFIRNNGSSSALNRYLRDHAEDLACAIFTPYLFGTTYEGVQTVPEKAIIVPCLHDEPLARLTIFREMFEQAAGIFFNTAAECTFATRDLGVINPYRAVLGYGFSRHHPAGDGAAFRARYDLEGPVLLYSGRIEGYKNVPLLLDYFVRYKTRHPGPLTLVLAGEGDVPIPDRPDMVAVGMISDPQALADAYAAATVLCQPSQYESFSLVLMEAWLQSRPVLVHGQCAVTREHVQASGGGATFATFGDEPGEPGEPGFCAALNRLLSDPASADEAGRRGRAYVLQHYTWEALTERMVQGITRWTSPCSEQTYHRLAQRGIRRALDFTHTRFHDSLLWVVEQARHVAGRTPHQRLPLLHLTGVGRPDYAIRSRLPLIGPLVAWVRRQMTAHLKEPYLDPIVARQEQWNTTLVQTLLPALEQRRGEQRRLRRAIELLRDDDGINGINGINDSNDSNNINGTGDE